MAEGMGEADGMDTEPSARVASQLEPRAYWERYGAPIDLDSPDDSRAIVLRGLAPQRQRVLELGCSAGYMTKVMAERGHLVTGVEIDPVAAKLARPFAERTIVGDLDRVDQDGRHLLSDLERAGFDTLLACDVLEHLRDPVGCLRRARDLVKPDGSVVLSIPNVAHGDMRLALLAGQFDYQENGLLDRTHIQLFTLSSLVAMIREVGLAPVRWERAIRPIGESEIDVDENLLEFGRRILCHEPEVDTYQWIVTCQSHGAASGRAIWPALPTGETVVAEVLDLLNARSLIPTISDPREP